MGLLLLFIAAYFLLTAVMVAGVALQNATTTAQNTWRGAGNERPPATRRTSA